MTTGAVIASGGSAGAPFGGDGISGVEREFNNYPQVRPIAHPAKN